MANNQQEYERRRRVWRSLNKQPGTWEPPNLSDIEWIKSAWKETKDGF